MTAMARIRSRRKPNLRLVGAGDGTPRHAGIVKLMELDWVVEVWTFFDWDQLAECERPAVDNAIMLPGLGFVAIRVPLSWAEREDVLDVQMQAKRQWKDERGLD
jgi:hypothetical protein